MNILTMDRITPEGIKTIKVYLLSSVNSLRFGKMLTKIFPESGHLEIREMDILHIPPRRTKMSLLASMIKVAESQAFGHQCTTVYGRARNGDEEKAYEVSQYTPSSFNYGLGDHSDCSGSRLFQKEGVRVRPIILTVYEGKKIRPHVAFVTTKSFGNSCNSHPA